MKTGLARLANHLYRHAPVVYRVLYGGYKRISDRRERALLAQRIRPGMTVLDVGANIGIYTRFLAELVGPQGKVIAFEPEPTNFAMLKAAVIDLPNVTVNHAAVCEKSGTLRLFVSEGLNVDHHSYDDGDGRPSIDVPAIALDDYLPAGARVDFIKMDIQGAEISALDGAARLLRENASIELLLEYWPFGLERAGYRPAQLLERLRVFDFKWRLTDGDADVTALQSAPDIYVNLHAWQSSRG